MLLRLRGPDGMARLNVEPTTTFGDLGKLVCCLGARTELSVLTLAF